MKNKDLRVKWTKEKIEKLRELVNTGLSNFKIAGVLNTTVSSIEHTLGRAGITRPLGAKSNTNIYPLTPVTKSKTLSSIIIKLLDTELSKIRPYSVDRELKVSTNGDTMVIQLSDFHAGKIVKEQYGAVIYDEHVFRDRMNRLSKQILKLLDNNISKGVPITDVIIISTGDQANGEDIYDTQAYEQELAPPKQVMLVVNLISQLIISLLKRNLPVSFYGVKGNHGRTGKDTDPTANWDLMIYMILEYWAKAVLKNNRLKINYVETDYMTFDIRNHRYLIRHNAPEQPDTPAGRVKFSAWAKEYKAEAIVYGHWHHFGLYDVDGIRIFRGPSIVGGDGLSENMAKYSKPIQLVWGVNDNRVCTFFYAVDLKGEN